jgi:tetratricopeptide (TPR) repeat protein
MNGQNTILILGDSTSMSIGVEKKMHPFISAEKEIWPDDTVFVNSSLPGMTSADACVFYFRHKKEYKNLRGVIIYLGNCDTASTEVTKGRAGAGRRLKFRMQEMTGRTPGKTSIKNRLLHFEWNNTFDPYIESAESPDDYEFNLSLIIKDCIADHVPVLIVRPKANLFFPSGIGKGNFVFYRYFGIEDRIAGDIMIPDSRFRLALEQHEAGNYKAAADMYNNILLTAPSSSMSQEYALMVAGNYAVVKAEAGEYEEALYLLNLLLKEQQARKEIIYFNIAYIYRKLGDKTRFLETIRASYEADSSLFRVREPYLLALDRLAETYPSVHVVNMHEVIPDRMFLDHCHPLPEGQALLSDSICGKLKEAGVSGTAGALIRNILYNPELGSGNLSGFHDYFKTYAPFTEADIRQQVISLQKITERVKIFDTSLPEFSACTREMRTAIEYYFRHPLFTSLDDIVHNPPEYPSDIGRFPEYFIIRHIVPYLRMHEKDKNLSARFSPGTGLLRTVEELVSVLPEKAKSVVAVEPFIDKQYAPGHVTAILEKVRRTLKQHITSGNRVYERTKSTIFWYVRETLRFGSHSRYSMRYDRLALEYMAEALAVAGVLDSLLNLEQSEEIVKLINAIHKVVAVHEEFCSQFSLNEENNGLLSQYDKALHDTGFLLN